MTATDEIAEAYLDDSAALNPMAATDAGIPGHEVRLREAARAAQGAAFDLRSFHRRVLDIGSVGLDVLQEAAGQP
jgi:hypothetical protein